MGEAEDEEEKEEKEERKVVTRSSCFVATRLERDGGVDGSIVEEESGSEGETKKKSRKYWRRGRVEEVTRREVEKRRRREVKEKYDTSVRTKDAEQAKQRAKQSKALSQAKPKPSEAKPSPSEANRGQSRPRQTKTS